MTPEYLNELADIADPDKLWRRAGLDRLDFTPEQKRQLDTGVALRRHASHVRRMRELLGTGKSLLLTPLSLNGTDIREVPMPAEIKKLLERENSERREQPIIDMKTIYLSGPMTGLPDLNFPAFHAQAARLRDLGYTVINPAELHLDPGAPWHACLRADLKALLDCDGIVLLDGWERSAGAHLEMHVAHRVGIEIVMAREITARRSEIA